MRSLLASRLIRPGRSKCGPLPRKVSDSPDASAKVTFSRTSSRILSRAAALVAQVTCTACLGTAPMPYRQVAGWPADACGDHRENATVSTEGRWPPTSSRGVLDVRQARSDRVADLDLASPARDSAQGQPCLRRDFT